MKRIISLVLGLSFYLAAATQITLLETTSTDKRNEGISFKKYRLENGLTIILVEDNLKPDVVVDVVYKVGSADDFPSKSGMAHFFEHLMFKGSAHVKEGEHLKLVSEVGGTANAQTFEDRTVFTNTVPSYGLERVLWLESDRMGFWINSFDTNTFENQKKIILNERSQSIETSPFQQINELANLYFFPDRHPYQKSTIGIKKEIQNISFSDLRQFYKKFYKPNNAILFVGGSFNENQTIRWIIKYFGDLPPGENNLTTIDKFLYKNKTVQIRSTISSQPMILLRFPSVMKYSKDFAAMDCMAYLLGSQETGYLKTMAGDNGYSNPVVFNTSLKQGGYFTVILMGGDSLSIENTERLLWSKIKEFGTISHTLLAQQILQYKNKILYRKNYEIQSVEGKIFNLYNYEINLHAANFFNKELKEYETLNTKTVLATFKKYFLDSTHLILSSIPSLENNTREDYYVPFTSQNPNVPIPFLDEKQPDKQIDTIKRNVIPPLAATNEVISSHIKYWQASLDNGTKFIGLTDFSNPVVSINFYFDKQFSEPTSPNLPPARLFSEILRNCPTIYSSGEEWLKKINAAAGYFYIGCEGNTTILQIKCLNKYLDEVLLSIQEKLLSPVITDSLLMKEQYRVSKELSAWKQNQPYLSTQLFTNVNIGLYTASGHNIIYNLEECKSLIKRAFSPNNITIVVNGGLTKNRALKSLSFLKHLNNYDTNTAKKEEKSGLTTYERTVYFFNMPRAQQLLVKCGFLEKKPIDDATNIKLSFANYLFGGYYSSRLNLNLREKQGMTYKAFSYVSYDKDETQFFIETSIDAKSLWKAYTEINKELDSIRIKGFDESELAFLKTAFSSSSPLLREYQYDKMKFMKLVADNQLQENADEAQRNLAKKISLAELNQIATQYFVFDKMKFLVIGDKNEILEQLKDQPVNLVEITSD